MPQGFTGADLEPVDVWVPMEMHQERETGTTIWREHRNWWWLHIAARLAESALRKRSIRAAVVSCLSIVQ